MSLNLGNVTIVERDITTLHVKNPPQFDLITARAVAKPEIVWGWSKNLLAPLGRVLLQTSQPFHEPLQGAIIRESVKVARGYVTQVEQGVN